ncbi:hypothetical protein LX32DRAFT_331186 [Colletotrichum zoysiae]|uniref:Uncharacterized protein n=1 Tax=Colletotrichum zoysiae TaxID=1216348 RepID=A0AAD9HM32_9PEZI|nr:hypothetical protein LX32DRAFT_331186 [Colletotrichum zoysiae]
MEGIPSPTLQNRKAWIAGAIRFLNQVAHADLQPHFIERASALRARLRICVIPHDNVEQEMAIHRDAIELQHDVHRTTNYRAFIRQLEEADTHNLVACYLPERSWANDMLRQPGSLGDCFFCREWVTDSHQRRDCRSIVVPPFVFLGGFEDERQDFCRWLQTIVAGLGTFPQSPTPRDDYVARVAEYSGRHSNRDNVWTYDRILNTMKEAKLRTQRRQLNYRQFLWTGWQDTLGRIGHDGATAATRVRGFLAPDRSVELERAINYDARRYYVRSLKLTRDQRCVNQRPRRWVRTWLRRYPVAPRLSNRWGRILQIDRVWPLFCIDKSCNNVYAKIQFCGTDRRRWEYRWLGRLDTPGTELLAHFLGNLTNQQAIRKAAEWRAELEREGQEGESAAGGGRAMDDADVRMELDDDSSMTEDNDGAESSDDGGIRIELEDSSAAEDGAGSGGRSDDNRPGGSRG